MPMSSALRSDSQAPTPNLDLAVLESSVSHAHSISTYLSSLYRHIHTQRTIDHFTSPSTQTRSSSVKLP